MAFWPLPDGYNRLVASSHNTADSTTGAVTVTASASTNTKGAYTELFASTSGQGHLLFLYVSDSSAVSTATNCLLDVAIGAASSETVVVADIPVGYAGLRANDQGRIIPIPVYIPDGSRVSVRMQSSVASRTCLVGGYLVGGAGLTGAYRGGALDTLGADTSTSRGVAVTGAGTANTKGAWAEITASTTNAYEGLVVCHSGNTSSIFGRNHLIDIGVGAAGSEVVLVDNLHYADNSNEIVFPLHPSPLVMFDVPIPAGSRIAVRKASSSASDITTDIVLLGIRR